MKSPIRVVPEEAHFEQDYSFSSSQHNNRVSDRDVVQLLAARNQALQDATIAFESVDVNGDGQIDIGEAQKLVKYSSIHKESVGSSQAMVDTFFRSFDTDGDNKISKSEWLTFYGNLFDDIYKSGQTES